ncbi:MAG TPA: hypothetical protein VHU84_12040 [Lacipirellulaceae bacterium]|jgi:hypothetical protein|nr:hypothetical protein [Lacipirellulaceae bacterium]
MKMRSLVILLCGLIFGLAHANEDKPAATTDSELTQKIARLVDQLNDDKPAERDAAEKQLVDLAGATTAQSDRFLVLLPKDNDQMPLAVRDRLGRIRQQVEDRVSKSATAGSTITLAAQKMPLLDVLKSIEQQTSNKFIDNRDEQEPGEKGANITLDLKNEPFWPAIDQILDQAKLGINSYGGEDALSIVARGNDDGPRVGRANYVGPFRLEAIGVQGERNLRQPKQTSLKMQLEVAWEPRLRPIALSQPVTDVHATTDTGSELVISQPDAVQDVEVPNGTQAAEIVLPFDLPARDVKKIAKLHGKLRALVPGRHVKFEFDKPTKAAGKSQQLGGVQVTLDDVRKNGAVWEVHMRFALDEANGALQSHRNWVFQNLSYLVDKDGKRIENAGMETTRQTANEVGTAYLFDVESFDGLTWVYETPAALVDLPIEYELKDIDLP